MVEAAPTVKTVPLQEAFNHAYALRERVMPYCYKAFIAGSVRRKVKEVGDIELVCVPITDEAPGLFTGGENAKVVSRLEVFFQAEIKPKFKVSRNGPRWKQFEYAGIQVDLFITTAEDFGRQLAIRTGPSNYSHRVIASKWYKLGWVGTSHGLRKKDQCIEISENKWQLRDDVSNPIMPPPFYTEEDFFKFLKIPFLKPEQRIA